MDDPLAARAAELLGARVLRTEALLPEGRRSRVIRCFLGDRTVVAKQSPDGREPAAYRRLAGLACVPRLLAADDRVVVLEDLRGERLDALLLRGGADGAAALTALARALGELHAYTARAGPAPPVDVERACAAWEIAASAADLAALRLEAGALTQLDVGPDNCVLTTEGARLLDFELADDRHPLTDAVAWHLGFPTGGCTGAVPAPVLARMDEAYASAAGSPWDRDAWAAAYVLRLLDRLGRFHAWGVLEEDWGWGRAGGRQRLLALLAACPREGPLCGELRSLHARLRGRWPDTPPALPPYPALSGCG